MTWRLLMILAAHGFAVAAPLWAQIPAGEYATRRTALAKRVPNGTILALGAAAPKEDYLHFSQTPDFAYLTGITEPDAALMMVVRDSTIASAVLFVSPRDPAAETWTGARLGTDGARQRTGLAARPTGDLPPNIDSVLVANRDTVLYVVADYLDQPYPGAILSRDHQVVTTLLAKRSAVAVRRVSLDSLRGTKSLAELELIRKAAVITDLAHHEAMRALRPGMNEFEIQALVEYTFRRNGADRPSFTTVIGSGPNSTTLHYNTNDRFMHSGDLVVMDIGASYRGYAGDITRTVPVNGRFTPEQRDIYQAVLDAQKAWERRAAPGADPNAPANRPMIGDRLTKLGLIEGPQATYDCDTTGTTQCDQVTLYTGGGYGHPVGLDVHDVSNGRMASPFTNEPGIYVRANLLTEIIPDTPRNRALKAKIAPAVQKYANIGVRIEDMYVHTETTLERLSHAPREIDEIEALMRRR
jgi:Xaa-Pro aminopeptidase